MNQAASQSFIRQCRHQNIGSVLDIRKFCILHDNVISPIPLVFAAEGRSLDPLAFVSPGTPGPSQTTIDPLVVAPPLLDTQGVRTPVPSPISQIAIYPDRSEIKTRLPAPGGLRVQDCVQCDMADITAHADMKMTIPVFRVHDHLDDGVLVEVAPDQVGDVALRPRLQFGGFFGAEVDDEVAEEATTVEAAVVGRGDLPAVVVAMQGAERVDAVPVDTGAVLAVGVLGPTGADRLVFVLADEIVG